MHRLAQPWVAVLAVLAAGCGGRTPLLAFLSGPPADADVPDADLAPSDASPDAETPRDVETASDVDAADAEDAVVADAEDAAVVDAEPDTDPPEPAGLSCLSGLSCALCCGSDLGCQMECGAAAPPEVRGDLMDIVICAAASGCGLAGGAPDYACLTESCGPELAACGGGPGGRGGCVSLALCLVTSGCRGVSPCTERGLCYQECFGAARPEVVGVARDLIVCAATSCAIECAVDLTSGACLSCLGSACTTTLLGCIGM